MDVVGRVDGGYSKWELVCWTSSLSSSYPWQQRREQCWGRDENLPCRSFDPQRHRNRGRIGTTAVRPPMMKNELAQDEGSR